jgi:16S rRNA (guanine527-N7)-methyltransferase
MTLTPVKWSDLHPWVTPYALPKLQRLRDLVLAANEQLNLTRITEESAFIEKHVLDSLLGLEGIGESESWVDVGAGGGFPGLVIAIARSDFPVLLVEAVQKKARFLEDTAEALGLHNVQVTAERAEDAARSRRETFTRASARAIGSLALCLEYTLPFVKEGGEAVLYRGPEDAEAEDALALPISAQLGGGAPRTKEHTLPSGDRRRIVFIPKVAPTPDRFPRRTGAASKRPLGP